MKKVERQAFYDILEELKIPYREDHHEPIFSVKEYDVELPGPQIKNLLVKPKKTDEYYLILAHDEKRIDMKYLFHELGTKRLSFPSSEEMYEVLGIEYGHLTSFSLMADDEHKVKVVVDKAIDRDDTIGVHPNDNTTTFTIQFRDLERFYEHFGYEPIFVDLP